MITKYENQTILKFGTGDICINTGLLEDAGVGLATFKNQTPREIGSLGDVQIGEEVSLDIFDVVMKFTRIESIDVVLRALNEVKEIMIESEDNK